MTSLSFVLTLLSIVSWSAAQQCASNQFAIKSNGEDYLVINSPTEVKTCGGLNICTEITEGKQTLTLDTNGKLSISSGNSVQLPSQTLSLSSSGDLSISSGNSVSLPDPSSTNELQTISLNSSGELAISSGNSVQLPDNSATNELQQLQFNSNNNQLSISSGNSVQLPLISDMLSAIINDTATADQNVKLSLEFVFGSSIQFVAPYAIRFAADGYYQVTMTPFGTATGSPAWFCGYLECTDKPRAVHYCNNAPYNNLFSSSRLIRFNAEDSCFWKSQLGTVLVPDNPSVYWAGLYVIRIK